MIQIYDKTTTSFARNGRALHEPLSCYMDEELNGKHEVELDYPLDKLGKWTELVNGNLLKVDGQVYRIYNKKKSLDGIRVNARHLFYDNLDNFLEDVRPENLSGVLAGQWILARTQYPNLFTVSGTLGGNATRYFIRKNVVEAFMGETGIINTWGGEIEHDNYNIILHSTRGLDRGVHIQYGKNILGIEETLDIDDVCTRMMPIGKDGLLLPEKYIDSPYIGNYPYPKIKTFEFNDAETEEALRTAAQDLMDHGEIDIPKANYKVDFIELSKTEEYKNYAVLERVYLGDTVTIKHSKLGFDLKARVIKVRKNILTGRNETLELGYFLPNLASSFSGIGNVLINMAEIIKSNKTLTQQAIDQATTLLTTAIGGYVTKRNGELLIMDTEDPMTATKLWRYNLNGFGYSKTGINGPFELAITMDGTVVAGTGFFNSIVTNLIASDIGSSLNLTSNVSITGLVEDKAERSELALATTDLTLKFGSSGSKNLIKNSGFIDGTNGWALSGGAIALGDTTSSPSGKRLRLTGSLNTTQLVTQTISKGFDPNNKKWNLSALMMNTHTTQGTTNPFVDIQLTITYTDATKEYYSLADNDLSRYSWRKIAKTITSNASKTVASFDIGIYCRDMSGGYLDIGYVRLEEGEVTHAWSNADNEAYETTFKFNSLGFEMKDANGGVLIEASKGIANEQNFTSTQNVEDGYPLNMSFRIGDSTSVITKVELRLKQYPFRTDSKGAASGGGSTSGPSSKSTTDQRWNGSNLTFNTSGTYVASVPGVHQHTIDVAQFAHDHGMAHTHTTPAHTHGVIFGILEIANDNGTIEVDINGVRRTGTTNTDITLDITTWITTNGVHNLSLRSPNLKRIQCDVFIKSYIRR